MAERRHEKETKIVMGYIRDIQQKEKIQLSSDIPTDIMKLCVEFYHILYKWDPSTKPNDNIEFMEYEYEYDTIVLKKRNWKNHNIFSVEILEPNGIYEINFIVHACAQMHLGICAVDQCSKYLKKTERGFQNATDGWSHFARKYEKKEQVTMTVDLINGALIYEFKKGSFEQQKISISKDKSYKIAFMAFGQPNKVQIV